MCDVGVCVIRRHIACDAGGGGVIRRHIACDAGGVCYKTPYSV